MARSQTNTARIDGLRPGMVYVVQVRARTVAGYGKFSGKMCFQTLTDGKRWASELVLGQHLGEGKKPREATLATQMPTFPGFQCHSLTSGGAVCTCVIHKAGHPSEVWPVSLLTSHGFAFKGSLHHMQGGHCSETHTYLGSHVPSCLWIRTWVPPLFSLHSHFTPSLLGDRELSSQPNGTSQGLQEGNTGAKFEVQQSLVPSISAYLKQLHM